jgi:rare lipoprotein A
LSQRIIYITVSLLLISNLGFSDDIPDLFESPSYLEFMDDSIRTPIEYEEINQCAGLLYRESGIASYYARKFHGRKTANGERFHKGKMTIAHKTLPFGSIVHVRDIKTDSVLLVRVNDRGPFVTGRIIDLSQEAAKMLNLEDLTDVEIQTLVLDDYFLPVNMEYLFAFSYDIAPMCVERGQMTILEEVYSFEEALDVYDTYTHESRLDFYICVDANEYNKRETENDNFIYYICKIKREPDEILEKK